MNSDNREVEVRFLGIDKPGLINKLNSLGATDLGEDLLYEVIFYDRDLTWHQQNKVVRLRKNKAGLTLTYKHHETFSATGVREIELQVNDLNKTKALLEELGLAACREQEKLRHSFKLDEVNIEIDTWPTMPPLVELEGKIEQDLKNTAIKLGLDWQQVVLKDQRFVIEEYYHIPILKLRYFTFAKIE